MSTLPDAIYSTLTGGTALTALLGGTANVYQGAVPDKGTYGCVVYNLTAGGDVNDCPMRRKELTYSIKAISAVSMANAGLIDAQIDALSHGGTIAVSGWTNYLTARRRDFSFVEVTPEGRNYYHCGGMYRFDLCKS